MNRSARRRKDFYSGNTFYVSALVCLVALFTPLTLNASESGRMLNREITTAIGSQAQAGACTATLSQELNVYIPYVKIGSSAFFVSLQYAPTSDGKISMGVSDFGPSVRTDCSAGDTAMAMADGNRWVLHIPSLSFGSGLYWVNFEYLPGNSSEILFKFVNYGEGGTWSGEGGMYLAMTKVQVLSSSDTELKLRESFPGGTEAQLSFSLLPNQTYTPTSEEIAGASENTHQVHGIQVVNSSAGDTDNSNFSYFVPNSALPYAIVGHTQATAIVNLMSPASDFADRKTEAADGGGWVKIAGASILDTGGEKALEEIGEMGFGAAGKAAGEIFGALKDVIGTWDMRTEYKDWMKRLDALQKCVENHNWDMESVNRKDQLLDSINRARDIVKTNTETRFLIAAQSVALDAIPLIWPVVSGAQGNADATLKRDNEDWVSSEERDVMKYTKDCTNVGYRVDGTLNTGRIFGTVCAGFDKLFTLNWTHSTGAVATYTFSPTSESAGDMSMAGTYLDVLTYTGSGTYTIETTVSSSPSAILINNNWEVTTCADGIACYEEVFVAERIQLISDSEACP